MSKKEEFPGPLKATPNVYKLIFENQRVTVFDVLIKPGKKQRCTNIRTMWSMPSKGEPRN